MPHKKLLNNDFAKELEEATTSVREAGSILKAYFQKPFRVVRKATHEMVAEVDVLSQQKIIKYLSNCFPNYDIISEEKKIQDSIHKLTWVIDPLDGTHNYIAGLPFSSVSVGLVDEKGFYLGVIYFPAEEKLFHAVKGQGAFCNGEPIKVSNNDRLDKAVVNYDNQFHLSEHSFANLQRIAQAAFTVRILGTATADLCLIASGIIDARIWNATKIVDIAAGSVILTEAGGEITNFEGDPINFNACSVVATNGLVHDQVLNVLGK